MGDNLTLPIDIGTGNGDVTGPVSSVTNRIVLFADGTGKILKQSTTLTNATLVNYGTSIATIQSQITTINAKISDIVPVVDITVATNGGSLTIADSTTVEILAPAAGIATFTLTMPASPSDLQFVRIGCGANAIAALTHVANSGQTLVGALTALSATVAATFMYKLSNTTWYRIS